MEAAEDPDDAQLWWPQSRPRRHDTIPCLVGQRDGDPSIEKSAELFDVYADSAPVADDAPGLMPPLVAVFDLAATDAEDIPLVAQDMPRQDDAKKMQDDLCTQLPPADTRTPWADVEDDDDTSAYCCFEDPVDDAAADADSRVPQTQGEQCALGSSDTLGYDYTLGPQSDIHAAVHIPAALPSDGFEATDDPGRGRREPVVAAAAAAAAATESLKGEAAATAAANDPDLPGSPEFLLCAGMQEAFQTHARSILPDVFPDSDEEEAVEEPHDLDHVDSPTQCGPMPHHMQQEHMQQPPCALYDHSGMQPVAAPYHAWSGYGMATAGTSQGLATSEHTLRDLNSLGAKPALRQLATFADTHSAVIHTPMHTQRGEPCVTTIGYFCDLASPSRSNEKNTLVGNKASPEQFDTRTSRTQCGLDVEDLNIFDTDLDADGSQEPSRTQCGLLPQQPMQQTPCAISDPAADYSGLPSTRTQCEPLPFMQPVRETLAQLLATTLAPSPSLEERYARLEAYAAATSAALALIQPDGFDGSTGKGKDTSTASEQLTFGPSEAQLASQHPQRGKGKGKGKQDKSRRSKGSTGKRGSVTGAFKASSASG